MFCCFRCRLKDLIECSRWFWLPRKSRKRRENEIPNLTFRLIYIYIYIISENKESFFGCFGGSSKDLILCCRWSSSMEIVVLGLVK